MDMNIQGSTLTVQNPEGGLNPHSTSLTAVVLPEVNTSSFGDYSKTGVSTHYAQKLEPTMGICTFQSEKRQENWYVLRTTYGREKKAYDFITAHGGTAFLPLISVAKIVKGKTQFVETSRIPNLFFAYGTEEEIKEFVYDNYNLPYLRFYYKHIHAGKQIKKIPLVVPDNQISSLKIICESEKDTVIINDEINKFKAGDKVRVTDGSFKGVEGIVARFNGQQRVGIVIEGILTAATAYIPNAFLEKLSD